MSSVIEGYINEFLTEFGNPADEFFLNTDKDGDRYEWPAGLTRWSTESAVDDLFGGRVADGEREALIEDLDERSLEWFRQSEHYGHRG